MFLEIHFSVRDEMPVLNEYILGTLKIQALIKNTLLNDATFETGIIALVFVLFFYHIWLPITCSITLNMYIQLTTTKALNFYCKKVLLN